MSSLIINAQSYYVCFFKNDGVFEKGEVTPDGVFVEYSSIFAVQEAAYDLHDGFIIRKCKQ